MSRLPKEVTVFEVGARDGLQNEPAQVPLKTKAWFIEGLARARGRNPDTPANLRKVTETT